jgi:hypothetical protein
VKLSENARRKSSVLQRSRLYDSGKKNLRFLSWSENFVVIEKASRGIYGPPLVGLLSCHELVDKLHGLQCDQTLFCFPHPKLAGAE